MEELVGAGVCVDNDFNYWRSCRINLLYCRHRSSREARRIWVLECHASCAARDVLPSSGIVLRLVYAVVAVFVLLSVLHRQLLVGRRIARAGRCETRC